MTNNDNKSSLGSFLEYPQHMFGLKENYQDFKLKFLVEPIKTDLPFHETWANSAYPDQMPQSVASDLSLHYFLTEYSIKIWIKMKITNGQP